MAAPAAAGAAAGGGGTGIGSAAAGAGMAAGLGASSRWESFGYGQMAASRAWDKWKDSLTRGPEYRMIGLRSAGLNPILAAGNPSAPLAFNAMGATGGSQPPPMDLARQAKGPNERRLLTEQAKTQEQLQSTGREIEAREVAQRGLIESQTAANAGNVAKAKADAEYFGSQYIRDLYNTQRAAETAGSIGFRMLSPTHWMGAAAAAVPGGLRFLDGKVREGLEEAQKQHDKRKKKTRKRRNTHSKGKQAMFERR